MSVPNTRASLACVRIFALAVALAAGVFVLPAKCQNPERILSGTVTDSQHEPLRGAVVQLEDESNLTVMTYVTGKTGHYRFLHLQGNVDYKFWASCRGHKSRVRQIGIFSDKNALVVNLAIKLN